MKFNFRSILEAKADALNEAYQKGFTEGYDLGVQIGKGKSGNSEGIVPSCQNCRYFGNCITTAGTSCPRWVRG